MKTKLNPVALCSFLKVQLAILAALGLMWLFFQTALAGNYRTQIDINSEPVGGLAFQPKEQEKGLRLISEDSDGALLELVMPEWQINSVQDKADDCQVILLDGFSESAQPGEPRLPVRGVMLGVPPEAEIKLNLLESEWAIFGQRLNICPEKTPQFDLNENGERIFTGYTTQRDPGLYEQDAFHPAEPVELISTGFIRSQRVVNVQFHPFRYNPSSGELLYARRLRVRLEFSEGQLRKEKPMNTELVDEGEFETTLHRTLLNYETARPWRVRQLEPPNYTPVVDGLTRPSLKILVDQDGLYKVSYTDLQMAGMTTAELSAINPRTFLIHNNHHEIDIFVEGETDGKFDPTDYLLFYGQKVNTKWTDTNVYWLYWGQELGQRMNTLAGSPLSGFSVPTSFTYTQRIEQNRLYRPYFPNGPEMERWYWDFLTRSSGTTVRKVFPFELDQVVAVSANATLRSALESIRGTPQHHTRVLINRQLVYDDFWSNGGENFFSENFAQSYLLSGSNKITVEIPVDNSITYDGILVNWFEIDYARTFTATQDELVFTGSPGNWEFQISGFSANNPGVLDISDATHPKWITGADIQNVSGKYRLRFEQSLSAPRRFLALTPERWRSPKAIIPEVPSNLLSPLNGADYVIISHADFITEMLRLADWREAQGLRTAVVDAQDIYDEFNAGVLDPVAIKNFLAYAYQSWQRPAPSFVVLVGDGHYDLLNHLGQNVPIFIPPYLADADVYTLKETAANNLYVTVSGPDYLPDMHLGLLSIRNPDQARIVVDKIISYDQNLPTDEWNRRVMFIADDYDPNAGDFQAYSEDIINSHLPDYYTAERIYYTSPPNYTTPIDTPAKAKQAIINGINAGQMIVSYIGHASTKQWAQVNVSDYMFHADLVPNLNNPDRLPFVVPMTCLDGYYIERNVGGSEYYAMAEALQRAEGKGAIASFSPTGLGVATGHDVVERGLFDAIFRDYITQVGAATTQAKLNLYAQTGDTYKDLIETYLLFGDPATSLHVLRPDLQVTKRGVLGGSFPEHTITYTIQYTNVGVALATHVVLSDTLPAMLQNAAFTASGATATLRPGSNFIWDIADLAQNQGGQIAITAQVQFAYHGQIKNEVEILSPGDTLTLSNNRDDWLTNIFIHWLAFPIISR